MFLVQVNDVSKMNDVIDEGDYVYVDVNIGRENRRLELLTETTMPPVTYYNGKNNSIASTVVRLR